MVTNNDKLFMQADEFMNKLAEPYEAVGRIEND